MLAALSLNARHLLDSVIIQNLAKNQPSIHNIIHQYKNNAGVVLKRTLPYEPAPGPSRKCSFDNDNPLVVVAHCAHQDGQSKVTLASGFALPVDGAPENVVLTCAHTLEEINHSPALTPSARSGTLVIARSQDGTTHFMPVSRVLSSLPRSDLLLLSVPGQRLPTVPISPYPAPVGTTVRAHLVSENELMSARNDLHWRPWLFGGSLACSWADGRVLGYRDPAGREAETGTYDALAHMLFEPQPTPGSSGGPIVDAESGAVVGVMRGTRMDSLVEGLRGWGVPAEAIYEMFSLPGLNRV